MGSGLTSHPGWLPVVAGRLVSALRAVLDALFGGLRYVNCEYVALWLWRRRLVRWEEVERCRGAKM
jgi:hypothetical protein